MADAVSLVNRSLLLIGARATVASLSEGSTEANAASILFTPTYEQLARAAPWNTFRKQATLSLLKAAYGTPENPNGTTLFQPPQPWLYSYAYPADCLKVRFILPTYSTGSTATTPPATTAASAAPVMFPTTGGQIPYAVAYDTDNDNNPILVILTNLSQAQVVYNVNQPNPQNWDSTFQQAFVAALAAFLVPALSLNLQLMQGIVRMSEGAIQAARVDDANEGVTVVDHVPDWISARGGGTGLLGLGYTQTNTYANYDSVAWPGS